ncbi:Trp biosynthesis-associated membrane protein [Lentzea sp. DG1S-22]|uniref:Trp biosynthesis-associated membrane protein n=1 Tax=Lentzea sp. DG1S-22 TaxID=3108822 RepID=UPI002E7642FC|nr:Trp biosynthesis-associated membrane protein [Lentzea sp. DG1S-22]WVH80492.1 Trp biosynthesis-associated membrane protein [Lentzea sp. DG1S-22]
MNGSRPLWIAALLLVGAAGAFWGAGSVPIALLSLASVAAVVALSGVARRVLGALLVVVGLVAGFSGHWLAVVGGVLLAGSGVLQVALGSRMPKIGVGGQKARAHDPETDMWRALERGDDPTDDKPRGGPSSNE